MLALKFCFLFNKNKKAGKMKKILLLMVIAASCTSAIAVDWQQIDTNSANVSLYIDKDSVKNINPNEYVYAIKYRVASNPQQVAYIKSNFDTNYLGVIQSGLFDETAYRPQAVFANPRVFMKPVMKDSFLSFAHTWVCDLTSPLQQKQVKNETNVQTSKTTKPEKVKPVLRGADGRNIKSNALNQVINESKAENMKEYVSVTGAKLASNWQPPKSGRNTQAIVILEIGADGSLQNYKFAKSSGDKLTDRSIMSAIELSAPFLKVPELKHGVQSTDIQFVFEYKYFRKSVI